MEKENWINEILSSTDHIVKVLPSDGLYAKIQSQLQQQKTVETKWVWLAAASMLLLVSLNIKIVSNELKSEKKNQEKALIALVTDSYNF
jgi:fucose permease